jgi:hypothetical protein
MLQKVNSKKKYKKLGQLNVNLVTNHKNKRSKIRFKTLKICKIVPLLT